MIQEMTADPMICSEPTHVNEVRCCLTKMNTVRNPFRNKKSSKRCGINATEKVTSDIQLLSEKKQNSKQIVVETENNTHPITLPSSLLPHHPLEEDKEIEEQLVPQVAFPYISELNTELKAGFQLIDEQMQPLPCELEANSLELPPIRTPLTRTLVLGLDNTLIYEENDKRTKTADLGKIRLRPHLADFLKAVSLRFEIIVTKYL